MSQQQSEVKDEVAIIKGGETGIFLALNRSTLGLTIQVKLHPLAEEFIRNLGNGECVEVSSVGRYWQVVDASGRPLKDQPSFHAYATTSLDGLRTDDGSPIGWDRLGQPLIEVSPKTGAKLINLSFLRLVGTSEGAGVKFGVRGVYSRTQLLAWRDQLAEACRKFYIEYLRPMDLNVHIITGGS